jgi:hypothetical protein
MKKFITMLELNNANADIDVLLRDADFQEKLAVWDNAHDVKKIILMALENCCCLLLGLLKAVYP